MKGYKGFKSDFTCNGFKYKESNEYKIDQEPIVCEKGFHYCENPLDVWEYYGLEDDNVFCEIEAIGDNKKDGNKSVTNHIKIVKKLALNEFIESAVAYVQTLCKVKSSGDNSQNASSGYNSQNASSGDNSQNASSGDNSQNASSGNNSKNASFGNNSQNASFGNNSQNASSGDNSQNASSGNNSKNASFGYNSKNASFGYNSQNASFGYNSKNASSGDNSSIEMKGEHNVGANIGIRGTIKGIKGSWITLAEYNDLYECVCVKSAKIDGKKIKENTWYKLEKGKFKKV